MMQSNQSNCNSIVVLRSDFASIFITPHLDRQCSPRTQLCSWLSASKNVCTFGYTALIAVQLRQVLDQILHLHASRWQCELLHFGDIPKEKIHFTFYRRNGRAELSHSAYSLVVQT